MARLGKFSGKVYQENEYEQMEECVVCITDEQANDEKWISEHHIKDLMDCIKCFSCPMSRR